MVGNIVQDSWIFRVSFDWVMLAALPLTLGAVGYEFAMDRKFSYYKNLNEKILSKNPKKMYEIVETEDVKVTSVNTDWEPIELLRTSVQRDERGMEVEGAMDVQMTDMEIGSLNTDVSHNKIGSSLTSLGEDVLEQDSSLDLEADLCKRV